MHTPLTSPSRPALSPALSGGLYAALAYLAWGMMPLYWKAMGHVPAGQMVAHRIVWSVLFLAVLISAGGHWGAVRDALRRVSTVALLTLTALLISLNWLIYIWAVQEARVIEASLGYYINPLLNVLLGAVFLGERLRRAQAAAVLLAVLGVGYQTLQLGSIPWIALALAASFGCYGLLRKVAPVEALAGLYVETLLLAPLALLYLGWSHAQGEGALGAMGLGDSALIACAGLVTALPLLWFGAAARRLRYTTIGFIQYLSPSCNLLLAVLVFGEAFTTEHAIMFGCIWGALLLYTLDSLWAARRRPMP